MRILLLQDAPHLPSYGGGNKANRRLLEGLAGRGHRCELVARAWNETMPPVCAAELARELAARGIAWQASEGGRVFRYHHRGVAVAALDASRAQERTAFVRRRLAAFEPDWILVSDDRQGILLDAVLDAPEEGRASWRERTVVLVHTAFHLPFGPQATACDARRALCLSEARAVLTVSRFAQDYLREHGDLDARLVRFPVFGDLPARSPASRAGGRVAMINPCPVKGLSLFLALARQFPAVPFAAVPTWGMDDDTRHRLAALPNLELVPPADDLDDFLATVRVLLVPSIIPETLGYVAIEAMLRGIPVLASDLGGLPEAKLGVPYLLPVREAERMRNGFADPPQDARPWAAALAELLTRPEIEAQVANDSRAAAQRFVAMATPERFAAVLAELAAPDERVSGEQASGERAPAERVA